MTDLITRLESAEEGSRELDAEIWEVVDPEQAEIAYWNARGIGRQPRSGPCYTESLDVAMTLVPDGTWLILSQYGGARGSRKDLWEANIVRHHSDKTVEECRTSGATPALALCSAALKARQAVDHPSSRGVD